MTDFFYDNAKLLPMALALGFLLGVVYDIFRIIRISRSDPPVPSGGFYKKISQKSKPKMRRMKIEKARKPLFCALTFFEDILFFLICALSEILFFLAFNDGAVRIYCLFFTAAGFFVYIITVGRAVMFFSSNIIFLFKCLIYWIFYIIMIPIRYISIAARKFFSLLFTVSIGRVLRAMRKKRSASLEKALYALADEGFGIFEETENVEKG